MEIIILGLIILATTSLFIYAYKLNLELQNNKLIKNLEEYDKKEKIKQQESKILGQKLVKGTKNKEKSTQLYNS